MRARGRVGEDAAMPTVVSHALLGAAAFTCVARGRRGARLGATAAAALAALPDADVLWWGLTTYGAPWGHRGMTHSLAAAVVLGGGAALLLRRRVAVPGGALGLGLLLAVVTASHGALDALTDGGRGIGFLLPFDERRFFAPARPIPVAPIGFDPLSPWLWRVLGAEALLLWPAAAALAWLRPPAVSWRNGLLALALAGSAIAWGVALGSL